MGMYVLYVLARGPHTSRIRQFLFWLGAAACSAVLGSRMALRVRRDATHLPCMSHHVVDAVCVVVSGGVV